MEKLQPELRFPEFVAAQVNEFKKYSFEELFTFSTGKNIKQKEASPEFETPCVRYGELYHMYNEVINKVFNKTNIDKAELHFSKGDEILLPSAGEDPMDIGCASALTLKGIAIGRTINILRPLKEQVYSPIYVSYYINHKLKKEIASLAKGVSISNVYNSDLKTLYINLPSLVEQNKIASFLSVVDEKLNLLKEKKEALEDYKKGVMQKIFLQEIRFKNEEGKAFSEWEEKSLGELFNFYRGSMMSKSDLAPNGDYLCIHYGELFTKYAEVINNIISKTDKKNGFLSMVGDILMPSSDVTPDGLAKASSIHMKDVILGGDMNILRPKMKLDSSFFSYLINFEKAKIIQIVSGTTIKHVYNKDIATLLYTFPKSKNEQTKIASFLSAIDGKIAMVSKKISETQEYKKGLLQQLFA